MKFFFSLFLLFEFFVILFYFGWIMIDVWRGLGFRWSCCDSVLFGYLDFSDWGLCILIWKFIERYDLEFFVEFFNIIVEVFFFF